MKLPKGDEDLRVMRDGLDYSSKVFSAVWIKAKFNSYYRAPHLDKFHAK